MTETQTYGSYTDDETVNPTVPSKTENGKPGKSSPLDDLIADINSTDLSEAKVWDVPDRPNWQVTFNTHISSDEFKEFRRQASGAKNRKARRAARGDGELDQFELFATIIQDKSEGILYKGEEVSDSEGDPLTMRSDEFVKLIQDTKLGTDVSTAAHAIEAFLTAGYMMQLGESIAAEAGFAGQADPVNP